MSHWRHSAPIEGPLPRLLQDGTDGLLLFETDDGIVIDGVHDFIMLEGAAGGRLVAETAGTPRDAVVVGNLLLETGDKLLEETD